MAKIAINGLGRIGRTILRILTSNAAQTGLEIVALNDIADAELCAYLMKYDSVFGVNSNDISSTKSSITINGKKYPFTQNPDLSDTDLKGVDLVLECTGKANSSQFAEAGLRAGASRILISGPSQAADTTIVIGANDQLLTDQLIVSNASCTTNALAPLARLIDDEFGLITANMTTIHCYTGSQPTLDALRGDFARSRAASLSMVPTTTSAGTLTDLVLPDLAGRIFATSVRVPSASVSAIDMSFMTKQALTIEQINNVLQNADKSIIGTTNDPLVSSDLRTRPESIIMALPQTNVNDGGMARIFGWYDNEWGFSSRMIDMAKRMV